MRILILLLLPFLCQAQPLVRGGDGKTWHFQKEYLLTDGMTFKYIAEPNADTARYFNPGEKKYELTITVREVSTAPQKFKVEAESATSLINAAVDPGTGGTTICCINPNAVIVYTNKSFNKQTKLRVRFARGNAGSGSLTFRIGSTSLSLSFPSTGSWSGWQEIVFPLEPIFQGDQPIQILSTMQGPCNLDWFEFE